MKRGVSIIACLCLALGALVSIAGAQTPDQIAKVDAAIPGAPRVAPAKPRKLLVFTLCKGFPHSSIPLGAKALERLGEKTGAYAATVSDDPAMFAPDKLGQFDAVCMLNTTGELFDDPALKQSLLDFVQGGKGLIGIHAATDCFYQWPEYGELIGGYFDGHPWGSGDTVTIKIDDPVHPVNRVFHGRGFQITDEIYQFKDPYSREKLRVLLSIDTAKTDMTKNGIKRTDGDFAVSWVRSYGQGRVFFCSLGHNDAIYWDSTILQHYLDGIQFAFGDLEADTAPSAQLPADYQEKAKAAADQGMLEDLFAEIAAYEPGKDASGLELVTDMVVKSYGNEPQRRDLEARFDNILKSDATFPGKQYAAKQLYIMGTRDSVTVLEPLLLDPENSDNARYALERMAPGTPDVALHNALDKAEGSIKVGLINTIGERRNPRSVADLSRYAASDDEAVALAAIRALGKIGGQEAADVLTRERMRFSAAPDSEGKTQDAAGPAPSASPQRMHALNDALLECADRFLADGNGDAAVGIYTQLYASDVTPVTRLAALQGLALAQGEGAIPTLVAALSGDDAAIRDDAATAAQRIPGAAATQAFCDALPTLPPTGQALLINALEQRGDASALPAVTAALKGENAAVRTAAVSALAVLGNASSVEPLAVVAATASGEEQQAARQSLALLRGGDIDTAIVTALSTGNDGVRAELARALGARYAAETVPTLFEVAHDGNEAVRAQAFAALGTVATADQLPALVDLMVKETADTPRAEAERAAIAALSRGGAPAANATVLLNAWANAKDDVRAQAPLVRVLGKVVDPTSLKALLDAAESRNADVQAAAVRALADWPDTEPSNELVKLAGETKDAALADIALRGYLRMLAMPSDRPAEETIPRYEAAFSAAATPDAKKLVLASLGNRKNGALAQLIARYLDDPDLKAEAAAAMAKLQKAAFVASASNNPGEAQNAVDGDLGTRWTTDEAQKNGQWFALDLGWEGTVSKVVLDAAASAGDYPRGYEVYVSTDGQTWGDPVAKGAGGAAKLEIAFQPTKGRYIKIVQTGSDGLWWSIHEMSVDIH